MYPKHLWPPLEIVISAFNSQQTPTDTVGLERVAIDSDGAAARRPVDIAELFLPTSDLLRRRAQLASREFSDVWREGRIIQITFDGAIFGVLLNRQVQGGQWIGWCTASETGWAGDFDVLLEPEDDPFEPMFGVVQTWNPISIELNLNLQAKVVGELSTLRLDAIRAVEQEYAIGIKSPIAVEPGRVALRTADNKFLVLTGTPLNKDDERHNYQSVYRSAAARLMAKQLTQRLAKTSAIATKTSSGLQRVKALFDAAWITRSAVVATTVSVAAYFFVANINLVHTSDNESVRFRSAAPSLLNGVDLRMQIKPQSDANDVNQLILNSGCEIVSGPDAHGFYNLKSRDVMASKAALVESTLVLRVISP